MGPCLDGQGFDAQLLEIHVVAVRRRGEPTFEFSPAPEGGQILGRLAIGFATRIADRVQTFLAERIHCLSGSERTRQMPL